MGRNKPIDVGIAGDAGLVAEALLAGLKCARDPRPVDSARIAVLQARRDSWFNDVAAMCGSDSTPIHPFRALNELAPLLTPETIVTTDVGFVSGAALGFIRPTRPRKFIPPTKGANCGGCLPAALGAKRACPLRPTAEQNKVALSCRIVPFCGSSCLRSLR